MSGIFISCRRDDTVGHAGRLFDHLSSTLGADGVFMDVDDILLLQAGLWSVAVPPAER
jgi:hypothetical protein